MEGDVEHAVNNLQKAVMKADSQLDSITWKLELFDKICGDDAEETVKEKLSVMKVIESVTQMKEECENLKQDLLEVEELEKNARDSLHLKATQCEQIESALRVKLDSHLQKNVSTQRIPLNQDTSQRLQKNRFTKVSNQQKYLTKK